MRQELLWETEDDIETEELKEKLKEYKEELARIRNQNKILNKKHEENEKIIEDLKIQVEEGKIIEEVPKSQLQENEEICQAIELEIVTLQKKLEKFEKGTKALDEILSKQRSPSYKT